MNIIVKMRIYAGTSIIPLNNIYIMEKKTIVESIIPCLSLLNNLLHNTPSNQPTHTIVGFFKVIISLINK